jgi:hypothetical protein
MGLTAGLTTLVVVIFQKVQETLFRTGKGSSLKLVHREMFGKFLPCGRCASGQASLLCCSTLASTDWYEPMTQAVRGLQEQLRSGNWANMRGAGEHLHCAVRICDIVMSEPVVVLVWTGTYGPLVLLLPPEKLAVITMHETVNMCLKLGNGGATLTSLLMEVGDQVQLEVNALRLEKRFGKKIKASLMEGGVLSIKRINTRAKRAFEDGMPDKAHLLESIHVVSVLFNRVLGLWPPEIKVQVAGPLVKQLLTVAQTRPLRGAPPQPVFRLEKEKVPGKSKIRGMVFLEVMLESLSSLPRAPVRASPCHSPTVQDETFRRMTAADDLPRCALPRYQPMVVPPTDWVAYDKVRDRPAVGWNIVLVAFMCSWASSSGTSGRLAKSCSSRREATGRSRRLL